MWDIISQNFKDIIWRGEGKKKEKKKEVDKRKD